MRPKAAAWTCALALTALVVENAGAPMTPQSLAQLGERFHRVEGQLESGSGLGVSIVQRIAALHGLALRYRTRADGQGVVAELSLLSTQAAGPVPRQAV